MQMAEFIQQIPKAELNVHIEGCLPPELILKFAQRNKIKLPYSNLEEIQKFNDLKSFLDIYYASLNVLQTEQDFYDLMTFYLQKAASQNVRHAEIFFDPEAHTRRGIAFATIVNGLHSAILDTQKKLNITAYLIMCLMRDLSVEDAKQTLQSALPFKEAIVAIGLDSNEINNPPSKFVDVFEEARNQGFFAVAIAGEVGPPEYIWEALQLLKVSRIDHGIACIKDKDLLAHLAAIQMPLTICPISNVKLKIIDSLRHHPIKKLYDYGIIVTLNSDDPAYFDAYINENFIATSEAFKFTKHIVYELALNSFNSSFLDFGDKQKLINELDKFYKQQQTIKAKEE